MKYLALIAAMSLPMAALATPDPADWDAVTAEADGQIVYWNAWGGSTTTNDFIAWVGERVLEDYGVVLEHVKLTDTADAVTRVQQLPNWAIVDSEGKTVQTDFTVPVEGYESPWAMAQVVFMYDTADMEPQTSMDAILEWSTAHPGRFTYPQPPDFLGTTFLKQALVDLLDDPSVLQAEATDETYAEVTAPLWDFLDALTPTLWREGRAYPATGPAQMQLIADGEVDLAISFSPGEATAAIANNQLPNTVRTYVLDGGTIGNASFVAVQDPNILGYGTVLNMDALSADSRDLFDALELGVATLTPAELGTVQAEPHPSWMTRIAGDWADRYGSGQ